VSDVEPRLPASLEQFGHLLVGRLHVLRRRSRRRRLLAGCALASALLAGSAIAATRALEGSSDRITPETYILDPAQVLYGQYQRDLQADMQARDGLLTLPAQTGILAGSSAYLAPLRGGGLCLRVLHQQMCGNAPDAHAPVLGLSLSVPDAPYVYVGIRAPSVLRISVRCGGTTRRIALQPGTRAFVYVAPRDTDPRRCSLTSALRGGGTVTSRLS
jgi:hypothetical protein